MGRSLNSLRALIVDDDRAALSVVSSVIRSIGMGQALQAVNGEDALNLFQSARPPVDFVICDYEMPKLGGIGLLKALRGAGHSVPFLMLTANADMEAAAAAKESGASGYISKPFTAAQIERRVRTVVQPLLA